MLLIVSCTGLIKFPLIKVVTAVNTFLVGSMKFVFINSYDALANWLIASLTGVIKFSLINVVTAVNNSLSGVIKFSLINVNAAVNDSLSGVIKYSLINVVIAVNAALKGIIKAKSKAAYKSLPKVVNASCIGLIKLSLMV